MTRISRLIVAHALAALFSLSHVVASEAQTTLADKPIFGAPDVPGNLALSLSVEFPTAISVANIGNYDDTMSYLGYFDPAKCYVYNAINTGTVMAPNYGSSYFQPYAMATGTNSHQCAGYWSGNFMNWAAMQTIDPFRWALTGGYRKTDSVTQTILEKAWGPSTEGSASENFNYRGTGQSTTGKNYLNNTTTPVSTLTPFTSWSTFNSGIWGNGNAMVFSQGTGYTSAVAAATDLTSVSTANAQPSSAINTSYRVYIRIDVCDPTTPLGLSGLEANCVQYPKIPNLSPSSYNYKPEGLMQQYANQIRYSVFGYLNGYGNSQQGGVLREPMGFIGPTYPQPLSTNVTTNTRPEWNATTGQMIYNPDPTLAAASGSAQSGVMNYLNGFGEYAHSYETYDNVSELYYAAIRYYENLGNVPQWYSTATPAQLDGFPAAATWADPIAYYCQKNFILGIGDDHTWYDSNVGGGISLAGRGAVPGAVAADTFNQAASWTTSLQNLEGITPTEIWPFDTDATYYIAGLAYGAHVNDIRPDATNPTMPGAQTVSTFWMDVEEGGGPENLNPFYLATKYGGFNVVLSPPAVYNMSTPLTLGQWDSTGATIVMNGNHTHYQPNNYYLAGNANAMVTGLASAFTSISSASHNISSAYSFQAPNITSTGTYSFAAIYYGGWYGEVDGSNLTFDANGNPITTAIWSTNTTLQNQLAGTGWSSNRRVATWNGSAGIPFEPGNITASQKTALTAPTYSPSTTYTQYLDYLRGDQTNEIGSTATTTTQSLRPRTILLGDIVNASLTTVPPPLQSYSDANNPGYSTFKNAEASRATMVYAGANDGMLHGFVGSNGTEQFAYVPSALFQRPTATPQVNGLAQLGNPNYTHHYYVDATPNAFDIDMAHTGGATGSPSWSTLLIGGLGKGGKSFYAIDVTDPVNNLTTEAAVASAVKWEFTDTTMGYSYGSAVVVKTAKYGWVSVMTSGYDNSDGYGYIYFVNPTNGALLEKVRTPSPSSGLTKVSAYVKDYSDETADSLYVGDLNGQLWRVDLTGTVMATPYPAPTLLATLTDPSGNPQPVTTEPEIAIHPVTRKRYVMVGTGQLLSSSDLTSTQMQTFYVILDGNSTAFNVVTTPITRSNLTPLTATQLTSINTLTGTAQGWYTDLGIDPTSGLGWRMIIDPVAYNGIVGFTTVLTSVSDPCAPGGSSRVYALDYSTATSVLQPSPLPYYSSTNTIIGVRIAGDNGTPELVVGYNGTPAIGKVNANLTGVLATRILNWREIPTTN